MRFLAYATGQSDTLPVDTPVRLYLGDQFRKTISPSDINDRRTWEVCSAGYAERSCPMSAVGELSRTTVEGGVVTIADPPPDACIDAARDRPTETGGSVLVVLSAYRPGACYDAFAVEIWSNDLGQITAVNLLLGRP